MGNTAMIDLLGTVKRRVTVWALTGLCGALLVQAAWADDYRVKYTYDDSINKVLTNVGGSSAFPDAVMGAPRGRSTYMQKAKERRAAAKKKQSAPAASSADADRAGALEAKVPASKAAASKSARKASPKRLAKAPAGKTVITETDSLLKIRTVDDNIVPAPRFEYQEDNSACRYAGDTWAFATYDASKRSPRLVRCYGWHKNSHGVKVRGWYDVDLNPLILEAARDAGVDPLLVEIIIRHESNFDPYARSPVGAVGLMQLMPETAGGLGISDVYDVRDNIRGGAQYIAYQLARFNSVPLALAAYNAGPGAVLEYGGVPPYAETLYYVNTIYGEYKAGLRYRQNHR